MFKKSYAKKETFLKDLPFGIGPEKLILKLRINNLIR